MKQTSENRYKHDLKYKKVNKTWPWALKVSYIMNFIFVISTCKNSGLQLLLPSFVWWAVCCLPESKMIWNCTVVLVCLMCVLCTGAGCCAHFLHTGNVYDKVLYKLLDWKLLWKQIKQSGGNSVDYRLHLPLAKYLQCAMKWVFVCYTTLNCRRRVLFFVHTLRQTYSTLTHRTPTLQNKHSAVVRRAAKDEIYRRRSST